MTANTARFRSEKGGHSTGKSLSTSASSRYVSVLIRIGSKLVWGLDQETGRGAGLAEVFSRVLSHDNATSPRRRPIIRPDCYSGDGSAGLSVGFAADS